jgi:hypothetical protein
MLSIYEIAITKKLLSTYIILVSGERTYFTTSLNEHYIVAVGRSV